MTVASTASPDSPLAAQQGASGASNYSRFVQRVRRRYAEWLPLLPAGAPVRPGMQRALDALLAQGLETGAALRVLRQLVMERLVVLDCDGASEHQAPLAVITRAMTELAELALDVAMQDSARMLDAQHGAPQAPGGERARMWVIGMGKLGARELNVSSDIDLIYVYDHDGETAGVGGRARISLQEYFAKAIKRIW